jgi:hypothetical protein
MLPGIPDSISLPRFFTGSSIMTFRACTSAHADYPLTLHDFRKILRLATVALLLASSFLQAQVATPVTSGIPAKNSCAFADLDFDGTRDIDGIKQYEEAIANFLEHVDFDKLDCIADTARSTKARFPGGLWKLHTIYSALDEPAGHATEEDWSTRLSLLKQWTAAKPNSVTARVALAGAYASYAWNARGTGSSDSVTESGWRLFEERLEDAKAVLDENSTLSGQCPEAYLVMQQIAQGQGLEQEAAVFERAIAFEPSYYYYERAHATLLLPRWYGEEGDAKSFAAQSADRIGGKEGDILYFQIAAGLVCPCDDPEFASMSWERMQKGFAAVEQKFGPSMTNLNLFALMASKFEDSVAADAAFKRIGENWNQDAWRTQKYFNQMRSWASEIAPLEAHSRAVMQEASANEQSPEGARYKEQVEAKFALFVRPCATVTGADLQKFALMLMVGKDGTPENGWVPHPTGMMGCVMKELMTAHIKKETPFPPPPRPSYWLKLEMDPATYKLVSN